MTGRKKLAGQRIAVLAADGFEKVELTAPVAALRGAGAEVDITSLKSGKIRGMNLHMPADLIAVDWTIEDVSARDYDGLLIPGGFMNPDALRQSAEARFDGPRARTGISVDGPVRSAATTGQGGRMDQRSPRLQRQDGDSETHRPNIH